MQNGTFFLDEKHLTDLCKRCYCGLYDYEIIVKHCVH